jgi:hypothetical protein
MNYVELLIQSFCTDTSANDLISTIHFSLEKACEDAASKVIDEIVKNPSILCYRWFTNKVYRLPDHAKTIIKDWLLNMNKVRKESLT